MIYAHWLAVRCSVQHRRPMFSRTALTVRLYLYHTHYVLSFLSFVPSSGRGEIQVTVVPGGPNTGGSTQRACASRRVGGEWREMGQRPEDAGEVGFISPVGIAWSLSLVHSCPSRVFQLPLAVRQPFAGLSCVVRCLWLRARTCRACCRCWRFYSSSPTRASVVMLASCSALSRARSSMNVVMSCPVSGSCHFSSLLYHWMERFS